MPYNARTRDFLRLDAQARIRLDTPEAEAAAKDALRGLLVSRADPTPAAIEALAPAVRAAARAAAHSLPAEDGKSVFVFGPTEGAVEIGRGVFRLHQSVRHEEDRRLAEGLSPFLVAVLDFDVTPKTHGRGWFGNGKDVYWSQSRVFDGELSARTWGSHNTLSAEAFDGFFGPSKNRDLHPERFGRMRCGWAFSACP